MQALPPTPKEGEGTQRRFQDQVAGSKKLDNMIEDIRRKQSKPFEKDTVKGGGISNTIKKKSCSYFQR